MFRFLIIDDEQAAHIAIKSLVDWEEYGVNYLLSAYNGTEAIQIMKNNPVDAVFVDMNMPVISGIDFLSEATKLFPNTKYVVISGYDSFAYAHAALKLHVEDYLLKPIDADDLRHVVEKIIHELPAIPGMQSVESAVKEIKEYIDKNYSTDISLDSLNEKYHFSSEYLNRKFKSVYGRSLGDYIQKVRMSHAKRLLADTGLNLQETAEKLGYKNANYFSKAFRKYFGESPSEYREAKKHENNQY